MATTTATSDITLLDLLSNSLILRHTAPYLPVQAILALAASSKSFRALTINFPDVFRHLDLSDVKRAVVNAAPLDPGGISWRAERMDEALTEDEFYSGPLRGIFSTLQRRNILGNVQTLLLDGLSVPADLVREIVAEDRFSVRILSIREAKNLNERKLIQVLKYAVRPSRPTGTPKLKGLYVFGPKDPVPSDEKAIKKARSRTPSPTPVLSSSPGAHIGAQWNHRSSDALDTSLASQHSTDKWYQSRGRLISKRPSPEWAETLQACEGIISFDAVLCRGPRHDVRTAYIAPEGESPNQPHPYSYLPPAVATIALGPSGCETCHSCPEGGAILGVSPSHHFPLLSPPPLHASTIRTAQSPSNAARGTPLMARCEECLRGRWCERCNKWWDESCYAGTPATTHTELQQQEQLQNGNATIDANKAKEVKVHMGLCIDHCLKRHMRKAG